MINKLENVINVQMDILKTKILPLNVYLMIKMILYVKFGIKLIKINAMFVNLKVHYLIK